MLSERLSLLHLLWRMSDGITREKETGSLFRKAGRKREETEGEDKQAAAAQEGAAERIMTDGSLWLRPSIN